MTSRKGFTLIELMVVIFIVGILAAVAIPIMRGRIDSAKWSEGKAGAGAIKTAARAYCAEKGPLYDYSTTDIAALGFQTQDLDGRYFSNTDYSIAFTGYDAYVVTVTNLGGGSSGEPPASPTQIKMDQVGNTVETP